MVALVLRIVFRSLVTLFLLTACVFFALHLTGDPARIMLGDGADATALAAFRAQWGLDKPLWEQFLVYLVYRAVFRFCKFQAIDVSVCLHKWY